MIRRRSSQPTTEPPLFHRNASVATSNPAYYESEWMINKSIAYSNNQSGLANGSQNRTKTALWKILPGLVLIILPWLLRQHMETKVARRKLEIEQLLDANKALVQELGETTSNIRSLQHEAESLERKNEEAFQELKKHGGEAINLQNSHYQEVEAVEDIFIRKIDELQKYIKENSQKQVTKKYGGGPHRVEVTVVGEENNKSKFIIEMALLLEMPHAIHHFLQMVELKLWDGLSFVHGKSSDIVVATPMTQHNHEWAGQRFVDANLTQMAFTEYSATYPPPHHHKYSVAFLGRPGGPDWYIGLEDDMPYHEHESTFGLVVEGRDVLDRFFLQKEQNMEQTLQIDSLRLIRDDL